MIGVALVAALAFVMEGEPPERIILIAELEAEVQAGRCEDPAAPEVRIYKIERVCSGYVDIDSRERFTVYRECPRRHREVEKGSLDLLELQPGRCAPEREAHRRETGGAFCAKFVMPYSPESVLVELECGG